MAIHKTTPTTIARLECFIWQASTNLPVLYSYILDFLGRRVLNWSNLPHTSYNFMWRKWSSSNMNNHQLVLFLLWCFECLVNQHVQKSSEQCTPFSEREMCKEQMAVWS